MATRNWTPQQDLPGIVALWDANQGVTVSGGVVTQWTDVVGGIVASGSNGPNFSSTARNGTAGLVFSNQYLTFTPPSNFPNGSAAGGIGVGAYLKTTTGTGRWPFVYGGNTSSSGNGIRSRYVTHSDQYASRGVGYCTNGGGGSGSNNVTAETWTGNDRTVIGQFAVSGSNPQATANVDGLAAETTTLGAALNTDLTAGGIGKWSVYGDYWDGVIQWIAVWSGTLADSDRQALEGWASWNYGLNGSNLPSGHPYKSARPTVSTGPTTTVLAVNSAAFRFSPGNWKGDTGRGGSAYRQTWNTGAYCEVTWNAGASSPSATLLIPSTSTGMIVSYVLNGVLTDNVAATGNIALSGIAAGASNTLAIFVRNNPQSARWNNGANTLQIQGLQIDSGSSAGTAASVTGWDLIVGDSLTEGIQADNGNDSFLKCWSSLFGQAIRDQGRDFCINACGYSGWLNPGDSGGDVPAYYATPGGTYADASSRWNKVDSGVALLDSAGQISAYGGTGTAPTNIWLVQGTNEALQNSSTGDVTASVRQAITALRTAAPSTKINIVIPFALYGNSAVSNGAGIIAAIKAGFSAYKSANALDTNVALIDFGATFSATLTSSLYGGSVVHGNAAMHQLEAARMCALLVPVAVMKQALPGFRNMFR